MVGGKIPLMRECDQPRLGSFLSPFLHSPLPLSYPSYYSSGLISGVVFVLEQGEVSLDPIRSVSVKVRTSLHIMLSWYVVAKNLVSA